jgi:two-component system sensor histidine kinase AlgZ
MTHTTARPYWLCQLAGWGMYVAITFVQGLGVDMPTARAIEEPLLSAALGIALTHAVRTFAGRRDWVRRVNVGAVWRAAAIAIALACVQVGVLAAIEVGIYGDHPRTPALMIVLAAMRWTLVFFVWLALYFGFALIRQRQQDELERIALEHALQAAKLRALETALNPHFLFNALNTVRALVADDNTRADAAITQLARLLRYALAAGREDLVSVARELEIVEDYLAIERLRLDTRLRIERDISPAATQCRVPAMLVQMLVENAIKHGVARRPDGGTLRITASMTDGVLAIEIENPRGPTGDRAASTGIGLANATERLHLLCGPTARLELDLTADAAIARLTIPQVAP